VPGVLGYRFFMGPVEFGRHIPNMGGNLSHPFLMVAGSDNRGFEAPFCKIRRTMLVFFIGGGVLYERMCCGRAFQKVG